MPKQKYEDESTKSNRYIKAIVEEQMLELGESICHFRNLYLDLERQGIKDIRYIDGIYQRALDKVLDNLINLNDLKVADIALGAVDTSLKIRRGMKPKDF